MQHNHSVYDTDTHFVIDPVTRAITNVNAKKNTLIQFDHNSEVFDFEIPRFVDGHDMLQCNEVKVHYINIDAKSSDKKNKGTYEVKDYGVLESNPNTAVFSWLISDNATQLVGVLNFLITFCCTENGVVVYRWSTGICQTVSISSGMDNGEAVIMEYPDILAQWKAELFEAGGNAVVNVTTAEANALAAIEAAGEAKKTAVLASIPDEYEALSILADQNHKNKAGAIVVEANGEIIAVNDASEYPLQNLKLHGKSTQDGTPTPTMPVDIVSVENPVVRVCGKNLIDCANINVEMSDAYYQTIATKYEPVIGETYTISMDVVTSVFPFSIDVGAGKNNYNSDLSPLQRKYFANNGRIDFSFVWMLTEEQIASGFTQLAFRVPRYSALTSATVSVSNIQLELGENATEYEPYIEPQTVETSRTLPGIPVSSGGNYTDANGQQWVCDEVDLARGVHIRWIGTETLTGGESWSLNTQATEAGVNAYHFIKNGDLMLHSRGFCTHFKNGGGWSEGLSSTINTFWVANDHVVVVKTDGTQTLADFKNWLRAAHDSGNPVTLYYECKSPIETPLSEAEITAFKALHTNKPNTTIMNDAGVYMSASYVADTKTYIDNKIKELMEGVTE
jgi:hypothetical protein